MNWAEFFAMGGKAFYVWGSYLVTLIVVGIEIGSVLARRRRTLALIREEIDTARDTRIDAARDTRIDTARDTRMGTGT